VAGNATSPDLLNENENISRDAGEKGSKRTQAKPGIETVTALQDHDGWRRMFEGRPAIGGVKLYEEYSLVEATPNRCNDG
jgi:hypothetical protein